MTFRSGFVAIVGPPNVGKSTLLNRLLGEKLAIVSPKPQTTRNRILGVYHDGDHQIVLVDTPGIHKAKSALHESMVGSAHATFQEVDIILLMIEIRRQNHADLKSIIDGMEASRKPVFLVINKIDEAPKAEILPLIERYRKLFPFEEIIPVSALSGDGVDRLIDQIKARLRPGPPFFPSDMKTDLTESFLVSEMIREKIYLHTDQELPYACAVTIEKMEDSPDKNMLVIHAKIHVETPSQKAILIGRKGAMIKTIGHAARREIQKRLNVPVFLDLMVRVEKKWSRNPRALRRLGY
jgi:GTP-binding protein Era